MAHRQLCRISLYGSMKPYLQEIAERIIAICVRNNIKLQVHWISRESGEIRMADELSKETDFRDYWLDGGSFQYIQGRFDRFRVVALDLFLLLQILVSFLLRRGRIHAILGLWVWILSSSSQADSKGGQEAC